MNGHRAVVSGMTVLLAGCILPLSVSVDADASDPDGIRGSGHPVTVSRAVRDFQRIEVSGVGRVVLQRTGRERLRITADDNLVEYIDSEVLDGTLYIRPAKGVNLDPVTELLFDVEAATVHGIGGSGAVGFEVDLDEQPELLVTLSGACALTARGGVDRLDLVLSGATGYRGLDLETRAARVFTSGVAWAEVFVSERLDAYASGVSWIRYAGDPVTVNAYVSGVSSIGPY